MKKYNQTQREEIVNKFEKSTEKKVAFAKAEGISVNTLSKWIEEKEIKKESPKFVKVDVPAINSIVNIVKIQFQGFEIIADENTSEELLLKVLRGVKKIC